MGSAVSFDWVFHLAGGVLGVGGLVLLLLALFRDRSRGRKRCPQCWYDMAGTPGLTCPECGHAARAQHRLLKTRRHWRRAGVGALVLVIATSVALVPAYQRGWRALIPTTAIVAFAPAQNPSPSGAWSGLTLGPGGSVTTTIVNGRVVIGAPPKPPAGSITQQLTDEFWERLAKRRTWGWQSRLFFNRYFGNNPTDFADYLVLPDRWPVGEQIKVSVRTVPTGFVAGMAIDTIVRRGGTSCEAIGQGIGILDGMPTEAESITAEMRLQYLSQVLYRTTVDVPIRIRGTPATFLEQLDDAATTKLVLTALVPRLRWDAEDPVLLINDRADAPEWKRIEFGIAFRVELFAGDQLVANGAGGTDWVRPVWKDWEEIRFTWTESGRERAAAAKGTLRAVIRGDAAAAGRMYLTGPFGKRAACWTGVVEVAE